MHYISRVFIHGPINRRWFVTTLAGTLVPGKSRPFRSEQEALDFAATTYPDCPVEHANWRRRSK